MKKFIMIIAVFLLSISLVGCNSPTDTDLENRVTDLEEQVAILESRLNGLVSTTGLNGQVDYYENSSQDTPDYMVSVGYMELAMTEKDYLDATKFPEYIFDELGEYIPISELVDRLCQKYLEMECNSTVGFQFKIQAWKPVDMDDEEYITRLSMMIVELSHYDFYTIDSPQLQIEMVAGGSQYMNVRMSLLVDDKYTLHPAIFWNGLLDTHIEGNSFIDSLCQQYYDDFVAQGTFVGFVLPNYK